MAKMKIKAKEKKGIVKVKAMLRSLMADKEEAEKKKIDVEYIKQVIVKSDGKVVYEVTTSGFMSENPLLKFKFNGKKGNKVDFTVIGHDGKEKTASKKIK